MTPPLHLVLLAAALKALHYTEVRYLQVHLTENAQDYFPEDWVPVSSTSHSTNMYTFGGANIEERAMLYKTTVNNRNIPFKIKLSESGTLREGRLNTHERYIVPLDDSIPDVLIDSQGRVVFVRIGDALKTEHIEARNHLDDWFSTSGAEDFFPFWSKGCGLSGFLNGSRAWRQIASKKRVSILQTWAGALQWQSPRFKLRFLHISSGGW